MAIVVIAGVINRPLTPEEAVQRTATAQAQAFSNNATATAFTAATARANQITIRVNYGTEKRRWLEDATNQFAVLYPNIKVELIGQGSMESYRALSFVTDDKNTFDGNKPIPELWSPGGSIQVKMLNAETQISLGRDLAIDCKDSVLSPLAFILWEDRAKVLEAYYKDRGGITFENLYDALNDTRQGRWEQLGGDPNWGLIKVGYTDPNLSNGGFMFLMGLTHSYLDRTGVVTISEVTAPAFADYAKRIASAISQQPLSSSGFLMDKFIREGPASYDMVILHEALAIENFDLAISRQGQPLRVFYPKYNLYSEHPLCLIDHPSITADQRAAAKTFQDFLLSTEMQTLALKYGYRPAINDVPVFGANTPFDDPRIRAAGISNNIGLTLVQPDGNTLKQLLTIWNRAVQ